MNIQKRKARSARRRKLSVRARIKRDTTRPRLSVHRSTKHMFAQIIDDESGKTLCAVGTSGKAASAELTGKTKSQRAAYVGAELARRAVAAGVTEVVLDRGASKYTGRVKALADAAREAGLKF
jgi:large subunit ribosomal protein L18